MIHNGSQPKARRMKFRVWTILLSRDDIEPDFLGVYEERGEAVDALVEMMREFFEKKYRRQRAIELATECGYSVRRATLTVD